MLKDRDTIALAKWVAILIAANGQDASAEEMEKISEAIQQLIPLGETEWRLGTLYNLLAGQDKSIARKLSPYIDRSNEQSGDYGKGLFSDYFDNDEDSFAVDRLVCMETGTLLGTPQVSAPFMDYAFYCIEKSLDGVTPTLIYIEEAWYMLSNPKFEEKINDWLRTFRKKKAFVIFATQSPIELQQLRSWAAFISNVPTYIFLRSIKDSVEQTASIYRALFNLNDAQLASLSSAIPKRDYLLIKPGVTRMVNATMPRIMSTINEHTSRDGVLESALGYAKSKSEGWQFNFLREVLNVEV